MDISKLYELANGPIETQTYEGINAAVETLVPLTHAQVKEVVAKVYEGCCGGLLSHRTKKALIAGVKNRMYERLGSHQRNQFR